MSQNEYDWRIILQHVYELCEEVGIKLRRLNKKAQMFGFSLRGSVYLHEIKTQQRFFDTGSEMFEIVQKFLSQASFPPHPNPQPPLSSRRAPSSAPQGEGMYIRKISVWASDLVEADAVPLSLFSDEKRKEKLIKTIDTLNDKFGDHTIRNGFLLYGAKLKTVPNGFGVDRYERTKLANSS
jgi:hypothetical protein